MLACCTAATTSRSRAKTTTSDSQDAPTKQQRGRSDRLGFAAAPTPRRPDVPLVALWYSRLGEPDYPSWMAEFADGEFEDEDGLVITWHKKNRDTVLS